MLYDYSKLRGKIREKYFTQSNFSRVIGIGSVSLSKKLNGKIEFSQDEILKAIQVLEISKEDIPIYFFEIKV